MPNKWLDVLPQKKDIRERLNQVGENTGYGLIFKNNYEGYNTCLSDCLSALEKAEKDGLICWVPSGEELIAIIEKITWLSFEKCFLSNKIITKDFGKLLAQAILSKLRGKE